MQNIQVTRQELYDLVGETPTRHLCQQFGLSDVGLANTCKRHDIPRPSYGYWAKKAAGGQVKRTPLPRCEDEHLQKITFAPGEPKTEEDDGFFDPEIRALYEQESQAEPIEVSLGEAASAYLPASASLDGRLRLPVPAGALIPADALGMAPQAGTRLVTLAIDPLHAPVGLAAGDVVDIWATGVDGANTIIEAPQLVLPEVQVVQVDGENLGVGGEMAVVVEVPQASAPDLVRSTRSRVLDLVAVPLQAMTPGKQS